jgi:hypothetical protein
LVVIGPLLPFWPVKRAEADFGPENGLQGMISGEGFPFAAFSVFPCADFDFGPWNAI